MANIYPSLISADQSNLEQVVKKLELASAGFHLDMMDGHFVPNTGMSASTVNKIATLSSKPVWVHLMVEHPERTIESLDLTPGSIVSFHFETTGKNLNLLNKLREKNLKASVAISPKTNVDEIFPLLELVHQVLIMTVEPGFSGQPFMEKMVSKIDPLIGFRETSGLKFRIAMDGGINGRNIRMLAEKGVDDFAVASAIFDAKDPVFAVQELVRLV